MVFPKFFKRIELTLVFILNIYGLSLNNIPNLFQRKELNISEGEIIRNRP